MTVALLTGSPAIDKGAYYFHRRMTAPTTDQRGALRGALGINAGANVDIGAYEASSSYLVATAADTTLDRHPSLGGRLGQRQHQ